MRSLFKDLTRTPSNLPRWTDTGPYEPIPARYHSVKTSGLETMIEPGDQTFDISVTGK
jgi:hypothetical protein